LTQEGIIQSHPVADMRLPRARRREVWPFSDREIRCLLGACDRTTELGFRDYAIQLLLLDCGLRATELCQLRWEDANLEDGDLMVLGKGDKERLVHPGCKTMRALASYKERSGCPPGTQPLVLSTRGEALKRNSLLKILRRIGKRAGVSRVHPHRYRHTFATRFVGATGDSFRLMRALGHTSPQMTVRYVRMADFDQRWKRFSVADELVQ
jgi:site-specific recombinase XerD